MKSALNILIIDDDPFISASLAEYLHINGYETVLAEQGEEGLSVFKTNNTPIVLLDQELPDSNGLDICPKLLEIDPYAKIIFITAHASVRNAVDAMQKGAFNYLAKPFSLEELLICINMAAKSLELEGKLKIREYENKQRRAEDELIGESAAAQRLRGQIELAAASDAAVLITGETGVGKNVVARQIHRRQNKREPLLTINCSAIPENLIETEYFGHEKGAFTGADTRREGIFELADGGTLLLDEIGDIPYHLQSKLLCVLEDKQVRRIGGAKPITVDVRIIAVTNQNLTKAIDESRFREDLYYRLAVINIKVQPLRQRVEDIAALAHYFGRRFCGGPVRIEQEQFARMAAYAWPGNIRELRNVIERASLLRQGDVIRPADLLLTAETQVCQDADLDAPANDAEAIMPLDALVKRHIVQTLEKCGGNKSQTAIRLGLSLSTLKRKLKSFG
ncbi:MAG: sigma-54-dependent Fis family transcriptional regulator [Desulfatitalea sp.]|nr:sigma-54 dependent transcriptional regulator [Desulfatitalea sp.]NNK02894.1 sigma-54-dependent Fis family transcriptional regulator [Desulfatitalea sp.]